MKIIVIFLFSISQLINADSTCSRTAIINDQEVLIDTNYSEKGEGLRFQIDKDPVAKEYLDEYQKNTGIRWQNAVLGTVGTLLIIAGIFTQSDDKRQRTLILSGAGAMTVNFFFAKTMENANERNLERAIEEYNKRNIPKIYFSPDQNLRTNEKGVSFFLSKDWSF